MRSRRSLRARCAELQAHTAAVENALAEKVADAYYLREELAELRRHTAAVERENDQLHSTLRRRKPLPDTVPMVLDLTRPGDATDLLMAGAAWEQQPEAWWRK